MNEQQARLFVMGVYGRGDYQPLVDAVMSRGTWAMVAQDFNISFEAIADIIELGRLLTERTEANADREQDRDSSAG